MNYKKLFIIQRELIKQGMPDDLLPLFFSYIGDLDETAIELANKHCFFEIICLMHLTGKKFYRYKLGHYCGICKKLYLIKCKSQMKSHLNSTHHKRKLEFGAKLQTPVTQDLTYWLKMKHPQYSLLSVKEKQIVLKDVKINKIDWHD